MVACLEMPVWPEATVCASSGRASPRPLIDNASPSATGARPLAPERTDCCWETPERWVVPERTDIASSSPVPTWLRQPSILSAAVTLGPPAVPGLTATAFLELALSVVDVAPDLAVCAVLAVLAVLVVLTDATD